MYHLCTWEMSCETDSAHYEVYVLVYFFSGEFHLSDLSIGSVKHLLYTKGKVKFTSTFKGVPNGS